METNDVKSNLIQEIKQLDPQINNDTILELSTWSVNQLSFIKDYLTTYNKPVINYENN